MLKLVRIQNEGNMAMLSQNSYLWEYVVIDTYSMPGTRQLVFKFDHGFAASYISNSTISSIMLMKHMGVLYATVDANVDEFDRFGIASPNDDDHAEELLHKIQRLHPNRLYTYKTSYEPFDY